MSYEEFCMTLKEELERLYAEEAEVIRRTFTGNNNEKREALCVQRKDQCVSPIIYLRPLYDSYAGGARLVDILADLVRLAESGEGVSFPMEQLESWESVRTHIGARLISSAENHEMLADVPHRLCMDMALVYYIYLDTPEMPEGTAVIHRSTMESWGVTEEELYRESRRNLPRMFPPCIFDMEDMLHEMLTAGRCPAKNLLEVPEEEVTGQPYVVTNSRRWFGAPALFYDGVLDRFMEQKGWSEVYVLPSSIHEMILVPGGTSDEERLLQMVTEVNDTSVEPSDRLTYTVYRYDRMNNTISRICSASQGGGSLYGIRFA